MSEGCIDSRFLVLSVEGTFRAACCRLQQGKEFWCILTWQLLRDLDSCLADIVLVLHISAANYEVALNFCDSVCFLAGLQAKGLELGEACASQEGN